MKLENAAYHNICNLTENVTVSPAEAGVWKKCLLTVADSKMKVQRSQLIVNLLRKLQRRGIGLNNVETFSRKNQGEGKRREWRRKRMVQTLMKVKREDAEEELRQDRERYSRRRRKLEERWGANWRVMVPYRAILAQEAARVWAEGDKKNKAKVDHLVQRWGGRERRVVEGVWRGIKIGDKELEGGEEEELVSPHNYGGVTTSAEEDSITTLPHKFTTFEPVQMDKIRVSTEILKDKMRWEMRAREERDGDIWTEELEFRQQQEKQVYRPEEHKMEFSRRRVTDIPTNRSVNIPDTAAPEVETVLNNISNRVDSVTRDYIKNKCDSKGNVFETNLTPSQQKGLKSLTERVKSKEIVAQQTDKGGDLALNTRENYIESMRPHTEEDPELSWEEHGKLESELNACTIQFARVLRVGAMWRHWPRVKSAVTSHHGPVPLLSGYPKTHKDLSHLPLEEQEKGPPVRPVCSASESNNGPLSDLLSQVITQLGDEMDQSIETLCLSTEEMAGGLEKVNNRTDINKLVVMSMDVMKMFPSLEAADVALLVKEEYLAAKLEVEVDDTELGLALAILLGREQLEQLGLGQVTCRRKRAGGRPIGITTKWVTGERGGATENLFNDPERRPSNQERRLMIALLLEQMILKVMGNHCYSFDGTNRLQLRGGPIGLKLSGALAKVCMLAWSRTFKDKVSAALAGLTYFNLYMLKFYVDDTGLAMEELEPGCRFLDGKVEVVEAEVERDRQVPGDLRTARVMVEIANSILPYLQFEADCPSNHSSGWMALLDLEVRVAEDSTVDYRFYSKPCASRYTMMRSSAMPARTKMNGLTQEVIRRLRNTRASLPWEEHQAPILTDFSRKMARSGYAEGYREEVLKSGVAGYERQLEASRTGEKPLFRPREWRQEERRRKKMVRKAAWYRPADCIAFYPATPKGELAREIGAVLEEEGARLNMKLRVVETGGVSLARQLVQPDLRAGEPCGRPGCVLDQLSGGAGGPHNRSSALYCGTCNLCEEAGIKSEYWGETGRSGYHRTLQHREEVAKRVPSNAFAKHLSNEHPEDQGDINNFTIKVVSTFGKSLTREKSEAVKIQSSTADHLLNSKSEHKQPALHRVRMSRENEEPQPVRGRGEGGGREATRETREGRRPACLWLGRELQAAAVPRLCASLRAVDVSVHLLLPGSTKG
jgi:hypothetical protein